MVQQMAGGYCVARCLHVVVELGVADVLGDQPADAGSLAEAVGAHRDALARVLRLLAAHGVFESSHGRFRHTAASRLLRADHPDSMRPVVRLFGLPLFWDAYGVLGHSVRTGEPATELLHAHGVWDWFERNPEAAAVFNAAMQAKQRIQVAAVLAAYDFSRYEMLADIGGGNGELLSAVLQACPQAKGILFDLPSVVAKAPQVARMACQGGNFFVDPLPSCDAYLLMDVIHEWEDDEALAILKAVRRAAPPSAELLLIEPLIPNTPGPDLARMLDIHMLALTGGRERTTNEYAYLLRAAGFSLVRTVETRVGTSILESIAR
jgi:hypothetical protein